jgi:hypothetical protein
MHTSSELADQVRNEYINVQDREDKFNNAWILWLAEFSTKSKHEAGSVEDQVRYIVKDRNLSNTTLMTELDTLTDDKCMHTLYFLARSNSSTINCNSILTFMPRDCKHPGILRK